MKCRTADCNQGRRCPERQTDRQKLPRETREDYHAETDPERAPIGAWIVWGFLIVVAVFLAVAFWNVWGAQ